MSETRFTMVSDWMANGNINDFMKVHPDANRLELVNLLSDGLPPSCLLMFWYPVKGCC